MLLSDIMLFGSLFAIIELAEKIPSATLNVYSKTLLEVSQKGIPFGLCICIHRTPGEDSFCKFRGIFSNLGRYDGKR